MLIKNEVFLVARQQLQTPFFPFLTFLYRPPVAPRDEAFFPEQ